MAYSAYSQPSTSVDSQPQIENSENNYGKKPHVSGPAQLNPCCVRSGVRRVQNEASASTRLPTRCLCRGSLLVASSASPGSGPPPAQVPRAHPLLSCHTQCVLGLSRVAFLPASWRGACCVAPSVWRPLCLSGFRGLQQLPVRPRGFLCPCSSVLCPAVLHDGLDGTSVPTSCPGGFLWLTGLDFPFRNLSFECSKPGDSPICDFSNPFFIPEFVWFLL